MIRRSFRFGLLLGVLGGVAFALTKVLGRPAADPVPAGPTLVGSPWPPLRPDPEASTPVLVAAAADLPFVPDPAAPAPEAPVVAEAVVAPEPLAAIAPEATSPPADAPIPVTVIPPPPPAPPAPPAPAARPAKPAAQRTKAPAATKATAAKATAAAKPPAAKGPTAKAAASPAAKRAAAATSPTTKAVGSPTAKRATGATKKAKPAPAWVEPTGGVCPTSHPVKAKLASKIFHRPGSLNYARTSPDRCYADVTQAEADGLRPAKR